MPEFSLCFKFPPFFFLRLTMIIKRKLKQLIHLTAFRHAESHSSLNHGNKTRPMRDVQRSITPPTSNYGWNDYIFKIIKFQIISLANTLDSRWMWWNFINKNLISLKPLLAGNAVTVCCCVVYSSTNFSSACACCCFTVRHHRPETPQTFVFLPTKTKKNN